MRKRRFEFLIALVLIFSFYIILFGRYGLEVKAVISLLYISALSISIYSLMLENRSPQHTLLWVYVLIFFPVLGYLFYLFSGQLYLKGSLFKSKRKRDRDEWKKLLQQESAPDFSFLQDTQHSFLKYASNASPTPISTASRAFILKDGEDTFSEIKKRLREAEVFIHMEYYIYRSDRLGKEIIQILIEKARKNVEVLFMVDAVGSRKMDAEDIQAMQKAGIKVQSFSPLKYGFFNQKINFRNHRKIIVIDGKVGFVGGLNVGVEYLGEDRTIGFWRDTHMLLKGEAVYSLHTVFLLDWEYVSGEKLLGKYTSNKLKIEEDVLDGAVQIVASGPDTQQALMSDFYFSMISSATKSIWIASPYFVPDEAIRTALRVAAGKGIEVRIMVPEINDGFLTQYASRSYFPELLRYGAEIYSYRKGFLHQKIIIIDGNLASLGTANMDMRSFHLNFEVNVFLYGTSSIRDLVAHYEEDMEYSEKISPVQYFKRGFVERSKESFARLFSGVL
ncbi:cardiolipin synthase [Bacillus sp. DTU_2020_1000418_1_SI_GHA_SEK_038]|uniref:cardiolipin synthase n=1 Tax=Bacillus sp. DTU_2020_1000418_1_SI_GHA_SEK_038 TaxID=3077585 RepID=UPI0028F07EAB|nr:cardiolipin synthase [Bacillus sp. DTU_2020_1000418_1_SI_GHA_SEK_038]WNS76344.1 cardiolipin synthase [Bacillus sp. DTU_2020_1000418_1_SI_GHA_SEK_038]